MKQLVQKKMPTGLEEEIGGVQGSVSMKLSYEGGQHYNSILSSESQFGRLLTPPGQFEDARLAELKFELLVMNGGVAEGKCDAVIKKAIKESLAAEASVDHSGDESEKNGGDDSSIPAPLPRSTAIWTNEHDWVGSRVMCWDAYKVDEEPGTMQFGTVEAHNASNDIFLVVMDDGMKSFINKDGVEAAKDEWERSDKKSEYESVEAFYKAVEEGLEQESIPRLEKSSSS